MNWPFKANETAGSILLKNKGIAPGLDLLRLLLALSIFYLHAGAIIKSNASANVIVAGGAAVEAVTAWQPWRSWREPLYVMLVPIFFALSGFLVTSSAFRLKSVSSFLTFRMLRIFPALTIEVTLSALVLGPIFTSMELREYFSHHDLFRYFGNIFGFVSFHLPGVFTDNPLSGIVNSSLWTLPPEFYCYLIIAVAMASTALYSRTVFTALFVVMSAFLIPYGYLNQLGLASGNLPTAAIVYYFFCGCLLFHWKDYIPMKLSLVIVAVVASYAFFYLRYTIFVAPLFLTYVTVAFGMTRWPEIPLMKSGDYSYGVYLYGFPISQSIMAALPEMKDHPAAFRALALVSTLVFATASWHLLEKHALRLKKLFISKAPAKLS